MESATASPWGRLGAAALAVALLAPSAWLAWNWRAMPQLGFYHDDSLYWVTAKSLAEGGQYRILSLPEQPFQTKYPPLFPALLSLVWKLNPSFPANLPWAALLVWCCFPVYLGLVWAVLRDFGFGWRERVFLTALMALNPFAALLSFSLMPEVLFSSLLMGALLLMNRRPGIAGVLGGLAYLAKSAALPLLLTAPVCFAARREFRKCAVFAGAMLPAVIAWQIWVIKHLSASKDLVALYYTNYLGFQIYNVSLLDLPLVIWHNLDGLLLAIGKLLTFDTAIVESKHLERVVAAAAIAGIVRLARKTGRIQFPAYALGTGVLLLVWHYRPEERFVFPFYPLLLAGLWTELKNVAQALRVAWAKRALAERVIASAMGLGLAGLGGFVFACSLWGLFLFVPGILAIYRDDLAARRPAYDWLARSAPLDAGVFAYDDPLVYLYAGRRACNLPVPTKLYYHNDQRGIDRLIDGIPQFASQHRLDYLLLTPGDFYRDLRQERAERLFRVAGATPGLQAVYKTQAATIYVH